MCYCGNTAVERILKVDCQHRKLTLEKKKGVDKDPYPVGLVCAYCGSGC